MIAEARQGVTRLSYALRWDRGLALYLASQCLQRSSELLEFRSISAIHILSPCQFHEKGSTVLQLHIWLCG
jgi:hypothetical protein